MLLKVKFSASRSVEVANLTTVIMSGLDPKKKIDSWTGLDFDLDLDLDDIDVEIDDMTSTILLGKYISFPLDEQNTIIWEWHGCHSKKYAWKNIDKIFFFRYNLCS